MLIRVKQKAKFTVDGNSFVTEDAGVVHQAPDWIVHDPYFHILKNHDKGPLRSHEHPSGEDHPMGFDPLLEVLDHEPAISTVPLPPRVERDVPDLMKTLVPQEVLLKAEVKDKKTPPDLTAPETEKPAK